MLGAHYFLHTAHLAVLRRRVHGLGAVLTNAVSLPIFSLERLWSGLAIITAILQLYHFLRPIDLVAVYFLWAKRAGWL